MKKVTSMIFTLGFAIAVSAQAPSAQPAKKTVVTPEAVKKAFDQKFPSATKVKWGMENAKEWEAEFNFKGSEFSANFTSDGTWVETEKEIKVTELPKAVADAIAKQYAGWAITEADRTETAKNGTIYEADIKNGKGKKEVAFKEDGTPVAE